MKLTQEQIARIFALYWWGCSFWDTKAESGEEIIKIDSLTSSTVWDTDGNDIPLNEIKLLLTPLPAITDEDAIEVAKLSGYVQTNKELVERGREEIGKLFFSPDTLVKGRCTACAVGNIVAANCGYSIVQEEYNYDLVWKKGEKVLPYPGNTSTYFGWGAVFCTNFTTQDVHPENYKGEAKFQIDSTGYSWQELAMIEKAFEGTNVGETSDERMFNSLLAVIDALDEIHDNKDLEISKASKGMFNKVTTA